MVQYDFSGRSAVVTGGARGIGLAVAHRFAASGAKISLWDADGDALAVAAEGFEGGAHARTVDVTDSDAITEAAAATVAAQGGIDILVNSAGITGPNLTTWDYPVEDWQRVVDVNLTGVFLCCRAVAPQMIEGGYGRIVNIASIAGKEGNPSAPAYSATKAGVIGLTKSLGKEL
jgi:3-oxoacyl-[acyl-carrier protein] reductase